MGIFGGIFNRQTKQVATTTSADNKIGASGGGTALRINASNSNINLTSDKVVNSAFNFVDTALTKLLNSTDNRSASTSANVKASQALASRAIENSQQTGSSQFIKLISIGGVLGVIFIAIKGGFKL